MEDISSQNLIGKYNRIQVIASCWDKNILRTNIQSNISVFNQIRNIQSIGNKISSISTKPLTPDNIGDLVKSPVRSEWYDESEIYLYIKR